MTDVLNLSWLVSELLDSGWQPHPDDKPVGLLTAIRALTLQRGTPEVDAENATHGKNPVAPAPWNEATGNVLVDASRTARTWHGYLGTEVFGHGRLPKHDASEPADLAMLRRLPDLVSLLRDADDKAACESLVGFALNSLRARALTILREETRHAVIPAPCPVCEADALRLRPMLWTSDIDDGRMAQSGTAYCRSCRAEWADSQLGILLRMLAERQAADFLGQLA